MATGTQGEPSAVLGRLATGRHHQITVQEGDTVIMSAHAIPGNEEMVHRIINRLFQRGANVLYAPIAPVHVSGHASQEEQKLLINLIRPRYFIPIHGELRHLKQHAALARELGIPDENIAVVENGTLIEFDEEGMSIGERVPGGYVFVDGASVGDVGPQLMRDRERLANAGFVVAVVHLSAQTGKLLGRPRLVSQGFVAVDDAQELFEAAEQALVQALRNGPEDVESVIGATLSRLLYSETKRRPMIVPQVIEM
jgi:ribonuclease J